jgi:hypothetical protein
MNTGYFPFLDITKDQMKQNKNLPCKRLYLKRNISVLLRANLLITKININEYSDDVNFSKLQLYHSDAVIGVKTLIH